MSGKIIPAPRNGKIPFGVWIHGLHHARNRDEMRQMVGRMVDQGVDLLIPCIMTYTTIPAETHYFTVGHVAVGRDARRGELWEGICCTDSRRNALEKGLMTRLTREAIGAGSPGLVVFSYPAMSDEIFTAIHQGMPKARKKH